VTEALLIDGCAIATVDGAGTEHDEGWILTDGARIAALGAGAPPDAPGARRIDGRGLLATPGLVNCHHHLYQWSTRGLAQEETLFGWLTFLYPRWARIDEEITFEASRAALAALAVSGCTTSTDHHYLYPRGGGDLLAAEIAAARDVGLRFHPCRGSMDLGRSHGGLPPDEVVEDRDEILAATERAIDRWHDPSPGAMLRIAVGPCSPFTVTGELMRESAALARRRGVRLHTHLAETIDEEEFCLETFGVRPVEYLDDMEWLGPDVWLAHCVHLSPGEVARLGATGTGIAHCPSSNGRLGSGIAPVADLVAAGVAVGLGVDGAASNESGELSLELREALLFARLRGGPAAMTARTALALGTIHGARCLGRDDEIGSLEPGKLADIALWPVADAGQAGLADPVATLVMGPPRAAAHVIVGGVPVAEAGRTLLCDPDEVARGAAHASARMVP